MQNAVQGRDCLEGHAMKFREFGFLLAMVFGLAVSPATGGTKTVCLLVKPAEYAALLPELRQWKTDVEAEGVYRVYLVPGDWGNAQTVRNYLRSTFANCANAGQPLAGALLVGDMPCARLDVADGVSVPIDSYYMDLTSEWVDANGNGNYDGRRSNQLYIDIWVGRLTPNMPDITARAPVELVRDYFRKNHAVRMGERPLRSAALIYADLHGSEPESLMTAGALYPETEIVSDQRVVSADDYLNRLGGAAGYEFVYLDTHSSSGNHGLGSSNPLLIGPGVSSRQIHASDPRAYFYWLDTCQAGQFTADDYLGGAYLFDTTYGLLAVALTRSSGMAFPQFCMLAEHRDDDWGSIVQHAFPNGQEDLVILGDPTLAPMFQAPACTIEIPDSTQQKPLRIPRPAAGDNNPPFWGIPVRGRMVAGGPEGLINLQLVPAVSSAALSPGTPRSLLFQGLGSRPVGNVEVKAYPDTPLGKYRMDVTGAACGLPTLRASGWIEVVDPAAVTWPQFDIRNAPAALTLTAGDRVDLHFTVAVTSRVAELPLLIRTDTACLNNPRCESGNCLCLPVNAVLEATQASQEMVLPLILSPATPADTYVVDFIFKSGGQAITRRVQITVRRPRLNLSFQPDAHVTMIPGTRTQRTMTVALAQGGAARVALVGTPAPMGLAITVESPGQQGDSLLEKTNEFNLGVGAKNTSAWADLFFDAGVFMPAGTYTLPVTCSLVNEPANRTVRNLVVEVQPQYAITIEPTIAGWLRFTVTNRISRSIQLDLAMQADCPASLLTTHVAVPSSGTATGYITYSTVFPKTSAYYLNRDYNVRLTATSPAHLDWPSVTCTYTVFKGANLLSPLVKEVSAISVFPISPDDLTREASPGGLSIPTPDPGPY